MRKILASAIAPILLLSCLATAPAAWAQSGNYGTYDPRTGQFGAAFPNDAGRPADTLAVTQAQAWAAVSAVYAKLGIPLSVVDSGTHVLGALRVTQRRPLAGERLSRLLECGTGSFGPNAERYTVQLTVLSSVQPLPDGRTTVDTRVAGAASPNGLSSSVSCASTGVLEDRITAELHAAATH
jgi:hypothetical protein